MASVSALGFGAVNPQATLGDPLDVVIPLRINPGESVTGECLAADVFFGENKLSSDDVRVSLNKSSKGDQSIRVQTRRRIEEPVFTVYVVAGCQVRMTRKWVGFADPPDMRSVLPEVQVAVPTPLRAPSSAAPSAMPSLSALSRDAQANDVDSPEPATAAKPTAAGSQTGAVSKNASRNDGTGRSGSSNKSNSTSTRTARPAAVVPQVVKQIKSDNPSINAASLSSKLDSRERSDNQSGESRLELDPTVADAMVEPSLALSLNMGLPVESLDSPQVRERRQAAAALWAAMNASPEQLAKDRVRMQELESRLARLQQDAAAASKQLQEMESRVTDAEQRRFMHPFVYALVGACLLLLAALAWLFLRHRDRQNSETNQWWDGSAAASEPDVDIEAEGRDAASIPLVKWAPENNNNAAGDEPTEPGALWTTPAHVDEKSEPVSHLAEPSVAKMTLDPIPESTLQTTQAINLLQPEPVREMTVEELIDLEQQAEFFVVLGQDAAAVELLESNVQSGAAASPLPCLKLLEIYKRLDRRADYERVQTIFNERFNGYAPTWEANLQHGLSLEDYPGVIERIQSVWTQPKKSMSLLQQSILRPNASTESFELPAYRELLMLYSIVRDLFDRHADGYDELTVDGLPRASTGNENPDSILSPLMATRPLKIEPTAAAPMTVDLPLDGLSYSQSDGPIEFVVEPDQTVDPKKT